MSSDKTVDQTPAEGPEPPIGAEKKVSTSSFSTSLEITKVVLEFLSKCFYPAILISLLYLLWPSLTTFDLNSLIDRLQSAKAGGYEFTFIQAQDVGAEIAPLNRKVAELERALTSVVTEIQKLQEVSTLPKPSIQEEKALKAKEEKLKANLDYTVLVFHRASSRERAATITGELLAQGFQSSDTETDFSELRKVKPEKNLIFLMYTIKGEEILSDIEKQIEGLVPGVKVRRNPRPIDLRRGDVQVLVF